MPFLFSPWDRVQTLRSVFVFFTILYRGDTLSVNYRIKHNSPIGGQFGQVFP
jgi:hypothetical protein